MADKEIRLGDIVSGDIPSPDAKWAIDGSGNLVITTPNGQYQVDTTLDFDDQTADPASNGEMQRNGSDVKVYSGGAIRNLSNIGSGGGGVDVEDDTTLVVSGSTAINFGTGLDVTDDGDTTATVDATGGGATDDSRIQMFARRGVSA
jgi:hypothetical protein